MKTNNIVLLIDQTGSMESRKADVIGGFNQFLEEQKRSKHKINFTMTLFDSIEIEKRYVNVDIERVVPLNDETYKPRACTPLWDAIGQTIAEIDGKSDVLFVIITDGEENSSQEYTSDVVRGKIKTCEQVGWKFLYLGVGLEKFIDAQRLGLNLNFKTDGVNTYQNLSKTVLRYCATGEVKYEENQ